MVTLAVFLNTVLFSIVVVVLLVHISSAVETVRIRRRLECIECLVLTVLTSGSITMGIYLCLQAGVFLVVAVCWAGVPATLANVWQLTGAVFALAFVGHVLAVIASLGFYVFKKRNDVKEKTGLVDKPVYEDETLFTRIVREINAVDVNTCSSGTKPASTSTTCDITDVLLHPTSGERNERIPLTGFKQCFGFPSHFIKFVDIFTYICLFLYTSGGILCVLYYLRNKVVLSNLSSNVPFDGCSTSYIWLCLLIQFTTVVIIGAACLLNKPFFGGWNYHVICYSLAFVCSFLIAFTCEDDHSLLMMNFASTGFFLVTLTVWYCLIEEVKALSSKRFQKEGSPTVQLIVC